jgi:hypothetical protein
LAAAVMVCFFSEGLQASTTTPEAIVDHASNRKDSLLSIILF